MSVSFSETSSTVRSAFGFRPKGPLSATGAPGFNTLGLQLFQWTVFNLGWPLLYKPTFTFRHDLPNRSIIGYGPRKSGPRGVGFPSFSMTWVALAAEEGQ